MKVQLDRCLSDFSRGWELLEPDCGKRSKLCLKDVVFDFKCAPHERPQSLRNNQRAIYIFFKGSQWLRIGQTDYSARFTSQHYGIKRAGSTLAMDVRNHSNECEFNGSDDEIGNWILLNCGRANLRLPVHGVEPKACEYFAKLLESYLHYRLNPRFEGRRKRRESAA